MLKREKNQLKKDSDKKNISESDKKEILVKTVSDKRKNISEKVKDQMLPERGEGYRCKGKTPNTFG